MKAGGPDGLEAWCVALSACFINFVMAGLGRMSGILYVAFIDIFQVDRMQASVPFSARSLTRNLLGPVVGIIGQKYGVRTATIMGGIIGTVSAAACFYVDSILWITVLWGAINGAGTALTITLPQVILGQHFKKYRTTASGMAFSGGCVGSFIFPVLLEYLLHTLGLGGTFLILSGIIMNVIPAAMVLRKPSWLKQKIADKNNISKAKQSIEELYHSSSANNSRQPDVENIIFEKDFSKQIDLDFLRQNTRLITLLLTTNFADRCHDSASSFNLSTSCLLKELDTLYNVLELTFNKDCNSKKNDKSKKNTDHKLENYYGKTLSECEKNEIDFKLLKYLEAELRENILILLRNVVKEDMKNIVTLFPEDEHRCISKITEQLRQIYVLLTECEKHHTLTLEQKQQGKDEGVCEKDDSSHPNTFAAHTLTACRLHMNPMYLLISFCRSAHFLTFVPAVTIIVDFSMDKGLLEEDGKYVIAALSFGDLMGRLCLGWVTDKEYISLPRYMFFVMIMQGVSTASLSFMNSKSTLLSVVALFGLLQGSLFVRHPVLVSKYLSPHEQSVAMGCINFLSGLIGFTLPSYIGYFRDKIGSYNGIFYINGAIGTFVGILWLFEPFFVRHNAKRKELN